MHAAELGRGRTIGTSACAQTLQQVTDTNALYTRATCLAAPLVLCGPCLLRALPGTHPALLLPRVPLCSWLCA